MSPFTFAFASTGTAPLTGEVSLRAAAPAKVLPAIATTSFLRANQLKVGSEIQLTAGQTPITAKVVSQVATFPTVTTPGGGLIVDLAATQEMVLPTGQAPIPVTQWWLATRTGAVPPGLPSHTSTVDRAALAAQFLTDPMSAIPQQAVIATAIAAALLAALGFSVSVAGSVRERRSQSALLAALGVDGRAQARLLCLEAVVAQPSGRRHRAAARHRARAPARAGRHAHRDRRRADRAGAGEGAGHDRGPDRPDRDGDPGARRGRFGGLPARSGRPVADGGVMRELLRRVRTGLVTITGTGSGASVVLALLVLASVFISVVTPRASLAFRDKALRQIFSSTPSSGRTVFATIDMPTLGAALGPSGQPSFTGMNAVTIGPIGTELGRHITAAGVPLTPGAQWWGVATNFLQAPGASKNAYNGETPPQVELIDRSDLPGFSKVVAGRLPTNGLRWGRRAARFEVAVTTQMAARFRLKVGSVVDAQRPADRLGQHDHAGRDRHPARAARGLGFLDSRRERTEADLQQDHLRRLLAGRDDHRRLRAQQPGGGDHRFEHDGDLGVPARPEQGAGE